MASKHGQPGVHDFDDACKREGDAETFGRLFKRLGVDIIHLNFRTVTCRRALKGKASERDHRMDDLSTI